MPEESSPDDPGGAGGQRQVSEPLFNLPATILAFIAICVAIHILRAYVISEEADRAILINFAFFPIRYAPEYFTPDLATLLSPLSYSLLHGDFVHLGINMVWLAIFGSPVAYRLGVVRTCLLWMVTAVCAVLFHTALYWGDPVPLIGASGAVSGFMGAAARFGFRSDRRNPRRGFANPLLGIVQSLKMPGVLPFLLVWMAVNYLAGIGILSGGGDASIAWEAHIGGLLAGFLLIGALDRRPAF